MKTWSPREESFVFPSCPPPPSIFVLIGMSPPTGHRAFRHGKPSRNRNAARGRRQGGPFAVPLRPDLFPPTMIAWLARGSFLLLVSVVAFIRGESVLSHGSRSPSPLTQRVGPSGGGVCVLRVLGGGGFWGVFGGWWFFLGRGVLVLDGFFFFFFLRSGVFWTEASSECGRCCTKVKAR